MKEKKKVKVSLSTITIFILIAIIIGMGLYIYKLNKDKYYMTVGASQQIEELNDKIDDLEDKIQKDENKENVKLEENNEDIIIDTETENNSVKTVDNGDLILNGQIVEINENTKRFTSERLKLSFEFPKSWMISQTINENVGEINIISPMASVSSTIWLFDGWYGEEGELKDMILLDYGSDVVDEGSIKISDCNAYYKEYIFGDGPGWAKQKTILIDLGNSKYYELHFSVSASDYGYNYSDKELFEVYDEYEPIFDQIISTLKFEK